ncbi:MAG: fatty acid desaturase [Bacteriovoracaceae bacterium]|nr:fatty acid desaturase [Bacteriovoracaceae bacterium]
MKYDLARHTSKALIQKHSRTKVLPNIILLTAIYLTIWSLTLLVSKFNTIWGWSLAVLITGALQHHLAILLHEASHFNLFPQRVWNERIGQALCGAPALTNLKDYRYIHLKHHKFSGDPDLDPEVSFYHKTKIGYGRNENRLVMNLVQDFTGVSTIRSLIVLTDIIKQAIKRGDIRETNKFDLQWGAIGWVTLFGVPLILGTIKFAFIIWAFATLVVTPILIRWHGIGEHTGVNAEVEQDKTLTHEFPFIVNFFLYPLKSGFHLEHHLFPQVPWYRMNKFRNELLNDPGYKMETQKLTVDGFWVGKRTVREIVLEQATEQRVPEQVLL